MSSQWIFAFFYKQTASRFLLHIRLLRRTNGACLLFVPSDLAWYELDQLLTLIEPSLVRYAFVEPELL